MIHERVWGEGGKLWWSLAQICGVHGGLSASIRQTDMPVVPRETYHTMRKTSLQL
jgi:hypothetical protein